MAHMLTKRITDIEVPTGRYYGDTMRAAAREFKSHTWQEAYNAALYHLGKSLEEKERAVQRVRAAADDDARDWALYYLGIVRWSVRCSLAHVRQLLRNQNSGG